ncbi:hypothetical protein BO70DRAFT_295172 [Aspergillus heteromorphus CBS 117.55]|uniref:Rootletin n=1 Tax=Aspergillus heteromorphus CBS 117.55 TaxID=1448321 RepID=A0A317VRQ1_9EURO|nr:uncharacterized protein BO70DRAFT_295172 [Aspergillus heteromorphus CBS 117.55]PWY76993.1 hypothetical protein BO70DRAFT_295172 [Aspergillus heteromorphus CBS 117.55]
MPVGANYDEEEEMLLLQMADNIEPVSPSLRAVMATTEIRDTYQGQRHVSPLLMERPKSSGMDMAAFCFSKPAQGPNSFSLQGEDKGSEKATASFMGSVAPNPDTDQNGGLHSHSLLTANQRSKVTKRRKGRAIRAPLLPSENGGSQLSEEDLFQLMITRIRDRENSVIAAVHLKEQMETDMMKMAEENNALKGQLELSGRKQQNQAAALKAYKSRMDTWRSKFLKFKGFLNELGCDYQNLRGEAIQLKAARKTLLNERSEITSSINEAKSQLAMISNRADNRRDEILKLESQGDLLRRSLSGAEESVKYLQSQLSDEKKRSKRLELFIQDCSQTQAAKLALIRSDQLGIMKSLGSAFEILCYQHDSSTKALRESIGSDVRGCLSSLKEIRETLTANKADGQDCKEIFRGFISRMDPVMHELSAGICEVTETNTNLAQSLKEQLQLTKDHMVSESFLTERLTRDVESRNSLQERLKTFLEAIEKISCSIQTFEHKEMGLADQMKTLEMNLSEMQIPQNIELLREESFRHNREVVEMEQKIRLLSEELRQAEFTITAKDHENEAIKISLLETESRSHETESRVRQAESEAAALRDEVKAVEARVREELSRASVVSRELDRAKNEQVLHELLREKTDIERNMEIVTAELAEAQLVLVRLTYLYKQQEKEVEDLRIQLTESMAKVEGQENEIERLMELESSMKTQQESLRQQLEDSTVQISSLEGECSKMNKENGDELEDLHRKQDVLQKVLQTKEDECSLFQAKLTAVMSEKSELVNSKAKAKEEIHTLLKRVQESEHWVNKIKEMLTQVGLSAPEESFSVAWSMLEMILRSFQIETTQAQLNTPGKNIRGLNTEALTPQRVVSLGHELFTATELVYKTQSMQASIISSPFPQAKVTESNFGRQQDLSSVRTPKIVPFSSIRQSSQDGCSLFGNEEDDIAAMMMLTQEKKAVVPSDTQRNPDEHQTVDLEKDLGEEKQATKPDSPKKADGDVDTVNGTASSQKHSSQAELKGEQIPDDKKDIIKEQTKQKAVTFEAQSPTAQKRKLPEPQSGDIRDMIEDRPRTTRRTYSRNRQNPVARAAEHDVSVSMDANTSGNTRADTTRSNENKRARDSDPSGARPQKPVNEYFERKSSPTKLASGSSKAPSMNPSQSNSQKMTRGRGGRKTRGEQHTRRQTDAKTNRRSLQRPVQPGKVILSVRDTECPMSGIDSEMCAATILPISSFPHPVLPPPYFVSQATSNLPV